MHDRREPDDGNDRLVVECRDLAKAFGARRAVDGVDFEVRRGELLALLGPSGCGKTTMLRLVAGFERPDAGEVVLDGRVVAGRGEFVAPERRRVGFVFQDYALFPHLTVADNIAYGLGPRSRLLRRRRPEAVDRMLELVGLTDWADRHPHELSGGMQQRVAIARALAPEPTIVLLDEPFSNLDATLRAHVRDEVRAILVAARATTLFVTHDQEEALSLADRVAVMDAGRVHQVATPSELYARPKDRFVATFVGDAELLHAEVEQGATSVATSVGVVRLAEPAVATGALDLAIRPEQVRLSRDGSGVGVVSGRTYYGHDQLLEVALADGAFLRARLGPAQAFRVGERVSPSVVGTVMAYRPDELR